MSKTRLMTAAAIASAGLVLTGCGGMNPGVAATVGDETISIRQVDRAAGNFCTALEEEISGQDAALSMNLVRQRTVQLLALRQMTDQIAAEYDITPGSGYRSALAQQEAEAATMPEEVRADFVDLSSANFYASDVLEQVGAIELDEAGVENPSMEQIGQAGMDVFRVWPDVNGLEIDPRYGLKNVDGDLMPVDTSLSVAVSDNATSAAASDPDVTYAKSLPRSQRCG